MKYTISLLLVCLSAALVRAQTQTVTDAAGETVVEVVTLDPLQGLPTTRTIQTLDAEDTTDTSTSTTTTTSTSSSSTTTLVNQGPIVGQPAPTLTGQTTFRYTTTDAAGNTEVLDGTFTPSSITATITPEMTLSGTILDYSEWLGLVGTNTVGSGLSAASSASHAHLFPSRKACAVGAALLSGMMGGAWLTLG